MTDEVELKREFEMVRARGYSADREESALERCCFGAPILDAQGDAIAALSLSSPVTRLRNEPLQKRVVAALRRASDGVARALDGTNLVRTRPPRVHTLPEA